MSVTTPILHYTGRPGSGDCSTPMTTKVDHCSLQKLVCPADVACKATGATFLSFL